MQVISACRCRPVQERPSKSPSPSIRFAARPCASCWCTCLAGPGESGERLCNEHLDEKAIVPSCGLATLTERLFTWRTADQVVCNVADNREVGRSIVGSHPALVIAEGHVHDPVKSILDAPVIANSRPDLVRGPRRRGNIEPPLPLDFGPEFADAVDDGNCL